MKKLITLLFALMICFSLTACGNSKSNNNNIGGKTLTCTKEETDDEGYKTTDKYVLTYNSKDIVTKVENTNIAEMDKNYIEFAISLSSIATSVFKDIDGVSMEITRDGDNKVKTVTKVDFTKLDYEKLKKAIGDDENMESSFLQSKNLTIDEFKSQNLKDYNCK